MKKRALLIVGLALAIATAGVVYAHWTDSLQTNVNVNTGSINMGFTAGTDDDGIVGNDRSLTDVGATVPDALYDRWLTASTADPAGMYRVNTGAGTEGYIYPNPSINPRYDKDVAICYTEIDGKTLTVTALNAYPSYFCSVFIHVTNNGTVPVKLANWAGFGVTKGGVPGIMGGGYYAGTPGWATTTGLPGATWNGIHELTFDIARGFYCGTQIDPGQSKEVIFWFHVEQGTNNSTMSSGYQFQWRLDFVNWNEYDPTMCTGV